MLVWHLVGKVVEMLLAEVVDAHGVLALDDGEAEVLLEKLLLVLLVDHLPLVQGLAVQGALRLRELSLCGAVVRCWGDVDLRLVMVHEALRRLGHL